MGASEQSCSKKGGLLLTPSMRFGYIWNLEKESNVVVTVGYVCLAIMSRCQRANTHFLLGFSIVLGSITHCGRVYVSESINSFMVNI